MTWNEQVGLCVQTWQEDAMLVRMMASFVDKDSWEVTETEEVFTKLASRYHGKSPPEIAQHWESITEGTRLCTRLQVLYLHCSMREECCIAKAQKV